MGLVLRGFNFLLYANIFIGFCAACLVASTYLLMSSNIDWVFTLFVFSGTIAQYGWHRWIGLKRVGIPQGRFLIVASLKSTIFVTAVISSLLSAYCFFLLTFLQQTLVLAPCLLAALYVLPILPGNQRLRDLPYIKIFVIAFTWTLLTSAIPLMDSMDQIDFWTFHGLNLERFLFIFAITIPFDIRDSILDPSQDCRTLVTKFGVRKSRNLALFTIGICSIIWLMLGIGDAYFYMGLMTVYLVTLGLIFYSSPQRPDWYFLLLVDGTMILILLNAFILS